MKSLLTFALGLAGGLAGAFLVNALEWPEAAPERSAARRPPGVDYGPEIAELQKVIAEMGRERAAASPAPETGPDASAPTGGVLLPGEGGEKAAGADGGAAAGRTPAQIVAALKGKPFRHAEHDRFFNWMTLHKEQIKDVIAALEKEVAQNPQDADLQVALATAYVADLANNVPQGSPQQGIIWMQADKAYSKALEINPDHWQARFSRAFGWSMAPEFLGLRPKAIADFEELLNRQQHLPLEPHFAQTYFRLGTLYKDTGNAEKAQEIWHEGLRLFPDNEVLKGTLEASTKK